MAAAENISGQSGNTLAVAVFDFDWYPGASWDPKALCRTMIESEDFDFAAGVESLDSEGNPTGQAKVLDPGTYSVVFFVGPPGSAPQHFVEVRAAVDGNITVSAPDWKSWEHSISIVG